MIKEILSKGLAGMAKTEGIVKISIKIYNLEEDFQFFIVKEDVIDCEFLLGLDLIKKFKLCQDENLIISQKQKIKNLDKENNISKISTNRMENIIKKK